MTVASAAPSRAPEHDDGRTGRPGRGLVTVLVGVAVATGVMLRFAARSELWLDEALTANIAGLPLDDLPEALRHDGAPPLYYVLLHGWMEVFGTSDVAVRALSGVCSVVSLPVAWFAGRRVGGRFVAWATVLVLASSPYAIRYATENRMYALQILLVLLGYLAFCRALERPSLARLAAVAVITGLLLYTSYWSAYLLIVAAAGLVWRAVRGPELRDRQAARSAIVALVAGGITFLPWLGTFLYQAENTGTPWGERILPPAGFSYAAIDFAGGQEHSEAYVLLVPLLVLALLALFGRALDVHHIELDLRTRAGVRLQAVVLVATLLLGLLASYAAGTTFAGRYAAVVFPLFALVVAYGFTVFSDARVRVGALAVVVALGFAGGVRNVVENRTQAEQSAGVIRAEAQPGDVVVYCPDQVGPDVSRLLAGEDGLRQVTFPDFASPELIDWVDYEERIDRADPAEFAGRLLTEVGDDDVWLVISPGYRNLEGECEALAASLGAQRSGRTRVEPDNTFFEPQGLVEYPAP